MLKMSYIKEIYYYYVSKFTVISQIINELIILAVFWYTAQAFIPDMQVFGNYSIDYFTFIVIGETALRLPAFFITIFTRILKASAIDGTFESYLLFPVSFKIPFLMSALASAANEFLRIIFVIILAKIIFVFEIPFSNLLLALVYQIAALPIFIGLGFISVAIFLYFGRGEGIIMKLVSVATILAGVYFPTTVLPNSIQQVTDYFSPFNLLLHSTRDLLTKTFVFNKYAENLLFLILWGIVFLPLGSYLFSLGLKYYKLKSRPFTFIS